MRRNYIDWFDDDCWELLFKKLKENRHDISSVSLVCKRFLTITNRIKTSLKVQDLSAHQFSRLLQRFRHLKSIDIERKPYDEVVGLISQILSSGLGLETLNIAFAGTPPGNGLRGLGMSMKSLKTLWLRSPWSDDDLIAITDLFPCLEDLKIVGFKSPGSPSVTDHGIEVLATKLRRLVKITLATCTEITDQSLKSLSSSGLNFTKIGISNCPKLTENGVGFMMRNSCSMLTSLYLNLQGDSLSNSAHPFTIKNSISYASKLEDIHISGVSTCDEVLSSVANSCHMLKKIYFVRRVSGRNFTIRGLKMLLAASPSVEHLDPGVRWLTDEFMVEISQYLSALTYIHLNSNFELTNATFYMLTKKCPLLETILMDSTSVGICKGLVPGSHKNFRVKNLSFCLSTLMDDNTLIGFCSICPNLERIYLDGCLLLTDEGISEIVRICSKLSLLEVSSLNVSNFFGANDEVSHLKLKIISGMKTKICDASMKSIGMRCPDLEELAIGGCQRVTRGGVEEVVRNCKNIKIINVRGCRFVSKELLDWMVKTRPWLRIIK